ncbi:MAG: hypothetical protein LAT65_04160 [Saccharospirillum sp.]|nr:hypothetical protein [Saccharospirillum sp.]
MQLTYLRSTDPDLLQKQILPRLKAYQVAYEGCDFVSQLYAPLSQMVGKAGADVIFLHSLEQLVRRFAWLHCASLRPPSLDYFDTLYNSLSIQSGDQASQAIRAIRIQLAQTIQSLLGRTLAQQLIDRLAPEPDIPEDNETWPVMSLPI